jgi:DNA replication and repair protein RecF
MLIRELQVINFRNLRFLRAEFGQGIHVIHGSNAQGKTNLLEAVYLLVTGRSFRTTMDRELIPWLRDNYEATLVRARVEKGGYEERFLLSFNQTEKHVFVNGAPIPRLGDLVGRINAVLFTPADLQLVRGAPGLRRRFLDIELSQINPAYLRHLQRYDLALRQRNALLKQHQRRPGLAAELAPWDAQLAENGAEIVAARARMMARLSELAGRTYAHIAGLHEPLALRYEPSPACGGDAGALRERLAAAPLAAQPDDVRRGATSVGPHRDDFTFLIDGRDARDFGSQGQQRSCVLAMKLAELSLMREATGENPILLLDDLMSELDESRKRAFLESLDPAIQTFITATEKELVLSLVAPARVYRVEDGEMIAEG